MDLQAAYNDEARRVAESTMHTFNNVLTILNKHQKLIAAKRLLKLVRDLVERLDLEATI